MTLSLAPDLGGFPNNEVYNHRAIVVVIPHASPSASSIVTEQEQVGDWRRDLVRQLVEALTAAPQVKFATADRFVRWLQGIPTALPKPYLGVAEDGAIAVEWDTQGNHLHLSFHEQGDEVYFAGRNGDEWEATLTPGLDKIQAAFRQIVAAR